MIAPGLRNLEADVQAPDPLLTRILEALERIGQRAVSKWASLAAVYGFYRIAKLRLDRLEKDISDRK